MRLKLGKYEADFPAWVMLLTLLVADNVYANHCKKGAYKKYLDSKVKATQNVEGEIEES